MNGGFSRRTLEPFAKSRPPRRRSPLRESDIQALSDARCERHPRHARRRHSWHEQQGTDVAAGGIEKAIRRRTQHPANKRGNNACGSVVGTQALPRRLVHRPKLHAVCSLAEIRLRSSRRWRLRTRPRSARRTCHNSGILIDDLLGPRCYCRFWGQVFYRPR